MKPMHLLVLLVCLASCKTVGGGKNRLHSASEQNEIDRTLAEVIEVVAKNQPSRFKKENVEAEAISFMRAQGMIAENEEKEMGFGMSQKWGLVRIVDHGDVSAVLMNLQIWEKDAFLENDATGWQVLALSSERDGKLVFSKFEEGFSLPVGIKVAFENQPPDASKKNLYYAELKESSAIDALKSIYTGQPVLGLHARLPEKADGKLDFDPTPDRKWKLIQVEYSLRRGYSAEAYDVFPDYIDANNYESVASACSYRISPWGAGYIRQVLIGSKWIEVLSPELAEERLRIGG